jgi:hypothetical protein
MPTADLRPLLRIAPESYNRLSGGLAIETEAHQRIRDEFIHKRQYGGERVELNLIASLATTRLSRIPGLFLEPYFPNYLSCVLPNPADLDARIELAQAVALALAEETRWRLDSAGLVRWALLPEILDSRHSGYYRTDLSKFDPALAARGALLRRRTFGPWLDGRVPVRHLEAFRAFHLGLDPGQQVVVLAASQYGSLTIADPLTTPSTAWAYALCPDLVASGWLRPAAATPKTGVALGVGIWSRRMAKGEMGPEF